MSVAAVEHAMSALLESLNQLGGVKLGTVVHIHPVDEEVIDRYTERDASRIVLVSADPDVVPALLRTAKRRTSVSVVEAVVASQAREVQWLRFNVRALNGLQQAGAGLQVLYPRLRVLECLPVVARTLRSVLEQLAIAPPELGAQNLLVIESPGAEGALLEDLSPELIGSFDFVLMRGARGGLFENARELDAACRWLNLRYFRHVPSPGSADSMWPTVLMRYDRHAAEKAVVMREISDLREQVDQLGKARDGQARAAAECQARTQELAEARSRFEKLAQDRLAQIEQLVQTQEEQARLAEIGRLAKIETLTSARDEQARLAAERQRRVVQLEEELADLTARQDMLREELIKAEAHVELISDVMLWEKVR